MFQSIKAFDFYKLIVVYCGIFLSAHKHILSIKKITKYYCKLSKAAVGNSDQPMPQIIVSSFQVSLNNTIQTNKKNPPNLTTNNTQKRILSHLAVR